jgi:hypothetical protein
LIAVKKTNLTTHFTPPPFVLFSISPPLLSPFENALNRAENHAEQGDQKPTH